MFVDRVKVELLAGKGGCQQPPHPGKGEALIRDLVIAPRYRAVDLPAQISANLRKA